MAIVVTQRWSGEGYTETSTGIEAELFYDVSGTSDVTAAKDALASSSFAMAMNASHPLDPTNTLKCKSIGISEKKGPEYFVLRAAFAIPPTGTWITPVDWLNRPPRYRWSKVEIQEETDIDAGTNAGGTDGILICNSAGAPYQPKQAKPRYRWELVVLKNELFFDDAKAETFMDRVNSNAGAINGRSFAARQCLCTLIAPVGEISAGDAWVPMMYQFQLDRSETYPFDYILPDIGRMGWANDGTSTPCNGNFVSRLGETIAEPVLLDGSGKPIDSDYRINLGDSTWRTPISRSTPASPRNTLYFGWPPTAARRVFYKYRAADFSTMGLV